MPRLILDIENENLKEEIKKIISKIDYPLRFDEIIISTSYKTDFLKGEVNRKLKILINPENQFLGNNYLFRGYFVRFLFLLINEKEGLNKEIEERLELPSLVEFVKNFFADYKAIKYGFEKYMQKFYLERITKKIYSTEKITKEEYLEFYTYYLNFRKIGKEGEIKSLLDSIKIEGLTYLLRELEKLSYPFNLGDENLKKEWMEVFNY